MPDVRSGATNGISSVMTSKYVPPSEPDVLVPTTDSPLGRCIAVRRCARAIVWSTAGSVVTSSADMPLAAR